MSSPKRSMYLGKVLLQILKIRKLIWRRTSSSALSLCFLACRISRRSSRREIFGYFRMIEAYAFHIQNMVCAFPQNHHRISDSYLSPLNPESFLITKLLKRYDCYARGDLRAQRLKSFKMAAPNGLVTSTITGPMAF